MRVVGGPAASEPRGVPKSIGWDTTPVHGFPANIAVRGGADGECDGRNARSTSTRRVRSASAASLSTDRCECDVPQERSSTTVRWGGGLAPLPCLSLVMGFPYPHPTRPPPPHLRCFNSCRSLRPRQSFPAPVGRGQCVAIATTVHFTGLLIEPCPSYYAPPNPSPAPEDREHRFQGVTPGPERRERIRARKLPAFVIFVRDDRFCLHEHRS